MLRWVVPWLLFIFSACHTPGSLCDQFVDSVDATIERCAIPCTYTLAEADTLQARTCDGPIVVQDPQGLTDCVNWFNSASCATFSAVFDAPIEEQCPAFEEAIRPDCRRAEAFLSFPR